MKRAHDELGFQYVRFHGLFDDDMSVVLGPRKYSWFNVDQIFDFLLSIGVRPFVELSFMPDLYRSSNTTIFHYKFLFPPFPSRPLPVPALSHESKKNAQGEHVTTEELR